MFCSFCLKTQYEVNFGECYNNKDWICPFCQGVCFCTRCLRQDTMTQLKAYFIALGGDLQNLQSSECIFDKIIYSNFNTHLQLTILSNPDLLSHFQNYQQFVSQRGYSSNIKYTNELLNKLAQASNDFCQQIPRQQQSQSQIDQQHPNQFGHIDISQGILNPEQQQISEDYQLHSQLSKLFEYCLLEINEEEKSLEKRKKLSLQTYQCIKRHDKNIIDTLKKRRGRKKFILIDQVVKSRLGSRDARYLEEVQQHQILPKQLQTTSGIQNEKQIDGILKDISNKIEQIEKIEVNVINKEKLQQLSEGSIQKDKKRRRTTHFTPQKGKKKKSLVFRRLPRQGNGKNKSRSNRRPSQKSRSLSSQRTTPTPSSIKKGSTLKQTTLQFQPTRISSASKDISKQYNRLGFVSSNSQSIHNSKANSGKSTINKGKPLR